MKSAQILIVWFPSETMRYRGEVGFTVPAFSSSRKTDKFAGYEKPVAETTSDPFNGEVIVGVAFKRESVVSDNEFVVSLIVVFRVFLVVEATHPPGKDKSDHYKQGKGYIEFHRGSDKGRMLLIE